MAIFRLRRSTNQTDPTKPPADFPKPQRNWPLLGLLLLAALVVATGVVLTARWAYREATEPSEPIAPAPQTTQNEQAEQRAEDQNEDSEPEAQPSDDKARNGTTEEGAGQEAEQNGQVQSEQLPDSGPGSVAALFIGTAVVAAGLHYVIVLRRIGR